MLEKSDALKEFERELAGIGESGDLPALVAYTGEALARFDNRWRLAVNSRQAVDAPVAEMLSVALLHCGLLRDIGQEGDADATAIMALVAVDISKADIQKFHGQYIQTCYELSMAMVALADAFADDDFGRAHADVLAREALVMFAYACGVCEAAGLPIVGEPARLYDQVKDSPAIAEGVELNGHKADPSAPAELLCDMLARLRALGLVEL